MDGNKRIKLKIPLLDFSDSSKRTRWFLRVVSLAFAIALWLFVTWDGTTLSVREVGVPLKYTDLRENYSITNTTRGIVVTIEGRVEALALLLANRNAITASVSLQNLEPGKYSLPVQVTVPENVRLVSYTPQAVEFELFRIIERRLQPVLSIKGEMPEELSLGNVAITPPEIVVKGPEADVLAIRRAEVQGTVAELRSDSTRELPVIFFGTGERGEIKGLIAEPRRVRVSAEFTEAVEDIRVPIEVSTRGAPEGNLSVSSVILSPDMVTLRGSKSVLAGISSLALDPVDVTGQEEDMDFDRPIESPGPGITIVGPDHANVRVAFRTAVKTKTYLHVPVKIRGRGVYTNWTITPPNAGVTVERSAVSEISADEEGPPLELYVDITNVVSRQLILPILVRDIANGVKVVRIEPEQITVEAVMP